MPVKFTKGSMIRWGFTSCFTVRPKDAAFRTLVPLVRPSHHSGEKYVLKILIIKTPFLVRLPYFLFLPVFLSDYPPLFYHFILPLLSFLIEKRASKVMHVSAGHKK